MKITRQTTIQELVNFCSRTNQDIVLEIDYEGDIELVLNHEEDVLTQSSLDCLYKVNSEDYYELDES